MSFLRIAVAGLALCASASVAGAQSTTQGHEGHGAKPGTMGEKGQKGRGHSMLLKGITLTTDQQAKLDAMMAKHHEARAAASPDGSRPDAAGRAKMRAEMEKHYGEIRTLLTADQQKVFDANIAEMKARREKRQSTQPRT